MHIWSFKFNNNPSNSVQRISFNGEPWSDVMMLHRF